MLTSLVIAAALVAPGGCPGGSCGSPSMGMGYSMGSLGQCSGGSCGMPSGGFGYPMAAPTYTLAPPVTYAPAPRVIYAPAPAPRPVAPSPYAREVRTRDVPERIPTAAPAPRDEDVIAALERKVAALTKELEASSCQCKRVKVAEAAGPAPFRFQ